MNCKFTDNKFLCLWCKFWRNDIDFWSSTINRNTLKHVNWHPLQPTANIMVVNAQTCSIPSSHRLCFDWWNHAKAYQLFSTDHRFCALCCQLLWNQWPMKCSYLFDFLWNEFSICFAKSNKIVRVPYTQWAITKERDIDEWREAKNERIHKSFDWK